MSLRPRRPMGGQRRRRCRRPAHHRHIMADRHAVAGIGRRRSSSTLIYVSRIDAPAAPRRPAHRPSRRHVVIDGAMGLFATMPVDEVTVQDIASAVEMTPAAVYYHFASKEQILIEGMQHFARSAARRDPRTAADARRRGRARRSDHARHGLDRSPPHRRRSCTSSTRSASTWWSRRSGARPGSQMIELLRDRRRTVPRQAERRRGGSDRGRAGLADRDVDRLDAQSGRRLPRARRPQVQRPGGGDRRIASPVRRSPSRSDRATHGQISPTRCRGVTSALPTLPPLSIPRKPSTAWSMPSVTVCSASTSPERSQPATVCSNSGRMSSWSRTMKPANRHPPQHRLDQVVDVLAAAVVGVLADHAAQGDAPADRHVLEGGDEMRAADVVEVDVDPVGRHPRARRRAAPRPGSPWRRRSRARSTSWRTLVGPAGTADHAAPRRAAWRTARRRSRPRPAAAETNTVSPSCSSPIRFKPDPGREPGLPEHAEPRPDGRRVGVDDGDGGGVDDGVLAPAGAVAHDGADRDRRCSPSRDHDADRRPVERLADLEVGRVVLLAEVEPAAHRRVDAHRDVAQQELARLQLGDRPLLDRRTGRAWDRRRARAGRGR